MKKIFIIGLFYSLSWGSFTILKNGENGEVLVSTNNQASGIKWEAFCDNQKIKPDQFSETFIYLSELKTSNCDEIEILVKGEEGVVVEAFKTKLKKKKAPEVQLENREQEIPFYHDGEVLLSYSGDEFLDSTTHVGVMGIRGRGYQDESWNFRYNLRLTTEGDERSQDLNHYRIDLGYHDWFLLSGGDLYPSLNKYVIDGEKVRGGELYLSTPGHLFSIKSFYGQNKSAITPDFEEEYLFVEPEIATKEDTLNAYSQGVYKRSILGSRIQIGSGENVNFGIMFLKTEDHRGDWDDPWNDFELSGFTSQPSPEDNLVLGSDLTLSFFKNTLEFFGGGFLSIYTANKNLKLADFSESIEPEDVEEVEKYNTFIELNHSTTPLPLKMDGGFNAKPLGHAATFNAGTRYQYSQRSFQAKTELEWYRVGGQYVSLGSPYLQNDRQGVEISENLVFPLHGFFVNANFGLWEDNLMKSSLQTSTNYSWGVFVGYQSDPTVPGFNLNYSAHENSSRSKKSEEENLGLGEQKNNSELYSASAFYTWKVKEQNHYFNFTSSYNEFKMNQEIGNGREETQNFGSAMNLYSVQWRFSQAGFPVRTQLGWAQSVTHGSQHLEYLSPSLAITYAILPNELDLELNGEYAKYEVSRPDLEEKEEMALGQVLNYEPLENHTFRFENKEYWSEEGMDWRVAADYLFLF